MTSHSAIEATWNMRTGADRGRVDQCAERYVDEGTFAHERIEQRSAARTACVMGDRILPRPLAIAHNPVGMMQAQLMRGDAGKGLGCRPGRAAALRAMADQRIIECVRNVISGMPAQARSAETLPSHALPGRQAGSEMPPPAAKAIRITALAISAPTRT